MTIPIVYPPGAHGQFLNMLLNRLSGITSDVSDTVYDRTNYHDARNFGGIHQYDHRPGPTGIEIYVESRHMLKYLVMCMNRTKGLGFTMDDLHHDTFNRVRQHPMLQGFEQDLVAISGTASGDVDSAHLREWIRLTFLDMDFYNVRHGWLHLSDHPQADFCISFNSMYDLSAVVDLCRRVLERYGLLQESLDIVAPLHQEFLDRNPDRNFDTVMHNIEVAMRELRDCDIANVNIIGQAWIDLRLQNMYGVEPLLQAQYPHSLNQLYKAYNL